MSSWLNLTKSLFHHLHPAGSLHVPTSPGQLGSPRRCSPYTVKRLSGTYPNHSFHFINTGKSSWLFSLQNDEILGTAPQLHSLSGMLLPQACTTHSLFSFRALHKHCFICEASSDPLILTYNCTAYLILECYFSIARLHLIFYTCFLFFVSPHTNM